MAPVASRGEKLVEGHSRLLAQEALNDLGLFLDGNRAHGSQMFRYRLRIGDGRQDCDEVFPRRGKIRGSGFANLLRGQKSLPQMPAPLQLRGAQPARDFPEEFVLQQAANEFRARIVLPGRIDRARKKHLRFDADEGRGQLQELAGTVEVQPVQLSGYRVVELTGDARYRDVEDVDILRPDEVQQQIQRAVEAIEFDNEWQRLGEAADPV